MSLIWTNAALEPKRKFRYLVTFTKLTDFQFLAQTCDRPGIKLGMAEHKYFDKSFYHPGKVTWDPNPLSVKLVDIQKIGNVSNVDTNEALLKVFASSGLTGLINATDGSVVTVGKQAAVTAIGDVNIKVLNSALGQLPFEPNAATAQAGDSAISEQWTLKNAWLESVKPESLDYGSEDILTVTMTLRYDWAEFKANSSETLLKFS